MFEEPNPLSNTRYTDSADFTCLENLEESSIDISLVNCGFEHCIPLHVCQELRDEYIIHLVLDGKGTFTCGGKSWILQRGQIFLVSPRTSYTYISDASDPWFYAWVGFRGILCRDILYHCGLSEKHPVGEVQDPDAVMSYIRTIIQYRQLTFANQLRRNGILMEFLSALIENHQSEMSASATLQTDYGSNIYVSHAIEYIQNFYKQPISVQIISEYVGVSRTHLNNCFQKELGISIQKFLSDYRMHKAANLLITSTDTIQSISASVGYPDSLAFSKSFKKKFGLSPKNYRNQKRTLDLYSEKQ